MAFTNAYLARVMEDVTKKFDELVALITERVKSFTNVNDLEIIVDEVLAEEGEVQQQAKQ